MFVIVVVMVVMMFMPCAVIVVDKNGIVRYVQVVPEITELPDMQAAMAAAKGLN